MTPQDRTLLHIGFLYIKFNGAPFIDDRVMDNHPVLPLHQNTAPLKVFLKLTTIHEDVLGYLIGLSGLVPEVV